ncbi:DUF3703 domain-containing protein [Archangium violaceum]|uniref:DUF3703 domain-containing protein n=1 Tax=Archangium violaceum TaxID=83451 RepID=UPI002B311ED4|nr:DUF3703 domain-containing protein [Archangium violaceum]
MPMKSTLRDAFEAELRQATAAERDGELPRAWRHLERAHILSQAHAGPHVRVHVLMFAFGWRRRDARELFGQLPRILVAAPGSWLRRAPLGNTGGANVGIFTPMPIPEDLRALLEA